MNIVFGLIVAMFAVGVAQAESHFTDNEQSLYRIVCQGSGSTFRIFTSKGVTMDVGDIGSDVTVRIHQDDNGDVLTASCRDIVQERDERSFLLGVDANSFLVVDMLSGEACFDSLNRSAEEWSVKAYKDQENDLYYLQKPGGSYVRIIEPEPDQVLEKGSIGRVRMILSEDLRDATAAFYLQRTPYAMDMLIDGDGLPMYNISLAENRLTWEVMTVQNVCDQWYLSAVINGNEQHVVYTKPFTIVSDWVNFCPTPLMYPAG
jgi:hypothetical protein